MEHIVNTKPDFFSEIISGRKKHEMRNSDRHFVVGDILIIREHKPEGDIYSGRIVKAIITYITSTENPCALSPSALSPSTVILSIELLKNWEEDPIFSAARSD